MGALLHYSSLARRFSPADLARAAARRAYRAAREALYQPAPVNAEAILSSFDATLESLPARVLRERPVWSDASRRPDVVAALSRVPGGQERALDRAQRAARREFRLFGSSISFADRDRIDWSLDPVSGRRYPMLPSRSLRLDEGGMDPKLPWALGRLDQLIALGQGYWVAPDAAQREPFAAEFKRQATDFIASNPLGVGIHWTSPMEVALRASNLALGLAMVRTSPSAADARFLLTVMRSLVEHCEFVEAHLEDRAVVPNNHLIANFVGLLVVGLVFPELPTSARQVPRAVSGLREQMQAQVHEDGYSFEGSVPYHRLSLELFTLAQVVARSSSVELGGTFTDRLRKMFGVAKAYCSEAGIAPQVGDNDSGRALVLRDRASLDHGYLAALGAALLREAALKRTGDGVPDEVVWLLGGRALEDFERMEGSAPPQTFSSPAGGLHLFRGGAALVAVSAGPNGQNGIGGHSHNDKLSFELHLSGAPVIVDPGSPTYLRDRAQRNAFRSTRAHNTVQLDDREQSPLDPERPFALGDEARARVEVWDHSASRTTLIASHFGYATFSPPVQILRTFLLHETSRALVVSDQVLGGGSHSAVGRLHLPDCEVRLRDATEEELARATSARPEPQPARPERKASECEPGVEGSPEVRLGTPSEPSTPLRYARAERGLRYARAERGLRYARAERGVRYARAERIMCAELGPAHSPRAVVLLESDLKLEVQESLYSPSYGEVQRAAVLVYSRRGKLPLALTIIVLFG